LKRNIEKFLLTYLNVTGRRQLTIAGFLKVYSQF